MKKRLAALFGVLLGALSVHAPPSLAEMPIRPIAPVVPIIRNLQAQFDKAPDSFNVDEFRRVVVVREEVMSIDDSCRLSPFVLGISLIDGQEVSAKGLKYQLVKRQDSTPLLTCQDDQIQLDGLSSPDFPVEIRIPLFGCEREIRNPAEDLSKEEAFSLLRRCRCGGNGFDLVLEHYLELAGAGMVDVAVHKPSMENLDSVSDLVVELSYALNPPAPARCVETVVHKGQGGNRGRMSVRTDQDGRALFTLMGPEDFPLEIHVPARGYRENISGPVVPEDADFLVKRYTKALEYYRQGRFSEAVAVYDELIRISPRAVFFNSRGAAKYRMDDLVGAKEDHTRALQLNPHDALALFNRGGISFVQGRYDDAARDISRAIEINGANGHYFYVRGGVHYEKAWQSHSHELYQREMELAVKNFEQALALPNTLGPEEIRRAYCFMGVARLASGKREQAMRDLQESCRLGFKDGCDRYESLVSQ